MEVTYLSPVPLMPVGGVRMFYIQAELLKGLGVPSFVYHPEKPEFLCDWFEHTMELRTAAVFRQSTDILIVPEMWALSYGSHCLKSKMRYGIFVQNGYQIDKEFKPGMAQQLRDVYQNASVIMTISGEVEKFLRLAIPGLDPKKIFRCLPYISDGFVPRPKKKTITYMPRKMPQQAATLCFFLTQHLPDGWSLVPVENVTDAQVREMVGESSIFLSFCEFEGLPAPPMEAAFAGNAVVGFTGGGGNEYFEGPIFTRVENGDMQHFVEGVLAAIEQSQSFLESEAVVEQRLKLAERYGAEALRKNVQDLALVLHAAL